jgi:hypothetical protein
MTSPQFPLSLAGSRFAKEMKMGGILFITPSNKAFANLRSSPLTPTPKGRGEGNVKFNFQV